MVVIRQSSIEFVVIGPRGGRDAVLIRSENASLDLIGFAAQKSFDTDLKSSPLYFPFVSSSRIMNVVESYPVEAYEGNIEKRKASYRLAWTGYCSSLRRDQIHEAFNAHVADVQSGIKEEDVEQIEWSLAPVIYLCVKAHERRNHFWRMMLFTLVSYGLIGLAALIVWLVKQTEVVPIVKTNMQSK
jgi:hypothetical protein